MTELLLPLFYRRKLKHQKVKYLVPNYTAWKWKILELSAWDLCSTNYMLILHFLICLKGTLLSHQFSPHSFFPIFLPSLLLLILFPLKFTLTHDFTSNISVYHFLKSSLASKAHPWIVIFFAKCQSRVQEH